MPVSCGMDPLLTKEDLHVRELKTELKTKGKYCRQTNHQISVHKCLIHLHPVMGISLLIRQGFNAGMFKY